MKKILASAAAGAAVCAAIFSAAPANAINEYVGSTYEDAANSINGYGGKAVIATRVGEYLPTAKCIVTGSRNGNFLDSSGNSQGGTVLLDLNCNDVNTAGHPGYSVMTPTGKKAQQLRESVTFINEDFARAAETGDPSWCSENADTCAKICEKDGAECSDEVLGSLGM